MRDDISEGHVRDAEDLSSVARDDRPGIDDVRDASRRIAPFIHDTQVMSSRSLDDLIGARVHCKCEHLQRAGAFKFRGAANAVYSLDDDIAARGVAAHSSGNHAAALALAASLREIPMPRRHADEHASGQAGCSPEATTGTKSGQIANGIRQLLDGAVCFASSMEIGTAGDDEQLIATYQEQWVHRHGDRSDPDHAAAIWAYRCCFTPDDAEWESRAMTAGRVQLANAVSAVADWE